VKVGSIEIPVSPFVGVSRKLTCGEGLANPAHDKRKIK
jgi:hypothetical protein